MTRSRRPSIAQAIFLLVLGTLAVATTATFVVTFRGPPPRPQPIQVDTVAALLAGKPLPARQVSGPHVPGPFPGRPPGPPPSDTGFGPPPGSNQKTREITVAPTGQPFAPRDNERPDPSRDRLIEAALGAPAGSVTGAYDEFGPRSRDVIFGGFTLRWQGPAGVRSLRTGTEPALTRWHLVTGATMLAAFLILLFPAWWVAGRISRPLQQLAQAARGARIGQIVPVPESGPREVNELATAFAAMQTRLASEVKGRTAMLAAIAHDLGTPLSRIAFHVEHLPDAARDRAAADIEEMRAMLGQVLRVARDERVGERVRVDLGSVIEALGDDLAAAGQPVEVTPGPRALVAGDPAALRRLFANLIENAIRYGERARVAWRTDPKMVTVTIADDGPGFDPGLGDRAFEPFVRGDPSRNRATGGSGLGLAIVRTLAETHGGSVTLARDRDGGGLVTVALPLA